MKKQARDNNHQPLAWLSMSIRQWIGLRKSVAAFLLSLGMAIWTVSAGQPSNPVLHTPQAIHITQAELNAIAEPRARFTLAFDVGDELFETAFNALDGVGANVGEGLRFTRIPRADLDNVGEWGKPGWLTKLQPSNF
ncbi:MAG: hypothetical protein OEU26_34910, partial [Candidatus Tectomicrobia bacterium]|nr:hypothetical protein [Candidatus Tectomicrobia bacterium]